MRAWLLPLAYVLGFAASAQGTGWSGPRRIEFACPLNEAESCGPHITFPDTDPTKATIQWWTNFASDSTVEYGKTTALSQSTTVPTASTCDVGPSGRCHRVTLTDLEPGTRYAYQLSSGGTVVQPVTSDTAFETLRAAADVSRPLAFVVIGDWGSKPLSTGAQRVAAAIAALEPFPQFMVTVGDNQYDQGAQEEWDTIALPLYARVWPRLPLWLALGNHDVRCGPPPCDCDSCMACWTAASGYCADDCACTGPNPQYRTFTLPPGGSSELPETYYSWESADAHFVVLNSNTFRNHTANDPAQLAWVDADLAATTKRWKFVFFHHAPWTCSSSTPRDDQIAAVFGPIFAARDVDVVFNGHVHAYERSIPNPDDTPGGHAVYIITGTGGSWNHDLVSDTCPWLADGCASHRNPGNDLTTTKCAWDGSFYSYTLATVTDNRTLTVQQLDTTNTVLDQWSVTKGDPTP